MSKRSENLKNRRLACQFAAQVMAGRPDEQLVPRIWSVTVFFESYMAHGSAWTEKHFGHSKPAKLKIVPGGNAA